MASLSVIPWLDVIDVNFFSVCYRLQLENTPNAKYLHTLNVFAHGTYKDYCANRADFIELTDVMTKKLRHLTIVSMAIVNKRLAYSDLQEQLDIAFVRDLEDLIIEGIYAGKLTTLVSCWHAILFILCFFQFDR